MQPPFPRSLQAVYIVSAHPFPEVDAFVEQSAAEYHLDLARYALPMRQALEAYLVDCQKRDAPRRGAGKGSGKSGRNGGKGIPAHAATATRAVEEADKEEGEVVEEWEEEEDVVRAIFVGTRRTDPHGEKLGHFDRTDVDQGWPDFMRVHPVIDWHYAEIWGFIRHLQIPYCPLYDKGYTSLGGTTDTHPNPALKLGDDGFRPAYELVEDGEERLGRDR